MRLVSVAVSLVTLITWLALAGCGAGSGNSSPATSTSSSSSPPTSSKYDSGPRAGDQPADAALATTGEQVFKDKGCSACHAFGTKMSGPDLAGVTQRRTAKWMEQQILHPEVMVKEDAIARGLMATHALQMPNQGLTPEQAQAVIEYLKHRDHEASEAAEESAEEASEKGGEGS
jgi:cbb3-type cytochrome oxidase cytochrome c subunit